MSNLKHFFLLLSVVLCSREGISVKPCPSDVEWSCDNGICIESYKVCDGTIDCTDGSDETIDNCMHQNCPHYAFRCAYGACVRGSAKCNRECECADGSDELDIVCKRNTKMKNLRGDCRNSEMQCKTGECIDFDLLCNGIKDCNDGSDETLEVCAKTMCTQRSFQCAYGGCIDGSARCNGTAECHDGSDEAAGMCGKERRPSLFPITKAFCPIAYRTTDICTESIPIDATILTTPPTASNTATITTRTTAPTTTITSTTTPTTTTTSTTPSTTSTTTTTTSTTPPTTSTTPPTTSTTTPTITFTTIRSSTSTTTPTTTTTSTPTKTFSTIRSYTRTTTIRSYTRTINITPKSCRIPNHKYLIGKVETYSHYLEYKPGYAVPSGDKVIFTCENEYTLIGEPQNFCLDGSWREYPPTCQLRCDVNELNKSGYYPYRCYKNGIQVPCGYVTVNTWAHVLISGVRRYFRCEEDSFWREYD